MQNTIAILSSINATVKEIAKTLAPKNGDVKTVSKLNQGNVTNKSDINPSADIAKSDVSKGDIKDVASSLAILAPPITALSLISGTKLRMFRKVIDEVIKITNKLAECAKKNKDELNGIELIAKSFRTISAGVKDASKLFLLAPFAYIGLQMTRGVIGVLGKILDSASAMENIPEKINALNGITQAINPLVKMVLMASLLVAVCLGVGLILMVGPTSKLIMGGLVALVAVILATVVLMGIVWLANIILKETHSIEGLKSIGYLLMGAVALLAICYAVGVVLENFGGTKQIRHGLFAIAGIMIAIALVFGLIGLIAKKTALNKQVIIGYATIYALMVVTVFMIKKIKDVGDYAAKNYESILAGMGWVIGIMTALVYVGKFAGKQLRHAKMGIVNLAVIEGLALGALALIGVARLLSDYVVGHEGPILETIGFAGLVVLEFGTLALLAGTVSGFVALGSAALAMVEVMALGAIGLTHLMIKLHKAIDDSGFGWGDIEDDIIGMSKMLGTFGLFAASMALLIVPITIGTPGLLAVEGLTLLTVGVVHAVVNVAKEIEKVGGIEKLNKTMSQDIPSIFKNINAKNFGVDMGILTMMKLAAKYAIVADLVGSVLTVAESISKIAQICGVVDENGSVRQILKVDKETGEVTYGEPVNLINVSTAISQAVKAFVENSQYSFADVLKIYNAQEIFKVLATITEPVTKFTDMLMNYTASGEENMLARIKINEKGEVEVGTPVDVVKVATAIAGAISTFVSELYKKENTQLWAEIIYGDRSAWDAIRGKTNKRGQAVSEVAGVLGVIVEPICKFVDLISGFESPDGQTLSKITIDKDGNITKGKPVNFSTIARVIAGMISTFVTTIYSNAKKWKDNDAFDSATVEKILKPVNEMISSATKLSSDKINTELIIKNSNAISHANTAIIESLTTMDINSMVQRISVVNSAVKVIVALSKFNGENINRSSDSLVKFMTTMERRVPRSKPKLDVFTKSINALKTSFKDLDTILIKDDKKRTKALDEFENRIKKIVDTVKDGKDSVTTITQLIESMQKWGNNGNNGYNNQTTNTVPIPLDPNNPENWNNGGSTNNNNDNSNENNNPHPTGLEQYKTLKITFKPNTNKSDESKLVYIDGTMEITLDAH